MNTNVERDINDIIEGLEESKIEEDNLDTNQVSFDKIVSILETNISDISDDWEREKLKKNEIHKTLEKTDALPEQEPSIHSDYAISLERENEKLRKMNNYLALYKKFLRTLCEKLFEYGTLSVTKHSAEHFIEKTEKMIERLSENQKLTNKMYIENLMEKIDLQRSDMRLWITELFKLNRVNNEVLLKISESMPTKELKEEIFKLGRKIDSAEKKMKPEPERKENTKEKEKPEEKEEPKIEKCPFCSEETKNLAEHLDKKHPDREKICKNCKKEFDTWEEVFEHKKTCKG